MELSIINNLLIERYYKSYLKNFNGKERVSSPFADFSFSESSSREPPWISDRCLRPSFNSATDQQLRWRNLRLSRKRTTETTALSTLNYERRKTPKKGLRRLEDDKGIPERTVVSCRLQVFFLSFLYFLQKN